MDDWLTIFELMAKGRPAERLVAAILSSGVEKHIALGHCVPATADEAQKLCRQIERHEEIGHDPDYQSSTELYYLTEWEFSPFAGYGWHAAKLPKELTVGDEASLHERRLRQAIGLGFDPSTGRANTGTTLEKIAKQMGMSSRQALVKSLNKAIEQRAAMRRAGSIVPQ